MNSRNAGTRGWGHDDRDVVSYSGGGGRGGGISKGGRRSSYPPSAPRRGRGGRARGGRGGGRGGGRDRKPPSKEALDAELESYMLGDKDTAKSKLDEDLEEYMKSASASSDQGHKSAGEAGAGVLSS